MTKHSSTKQDAAFGIVPILRKGSEYQFLLIQHHQGHWGFPKGHADPGESALETACREFVEETGIKDYQLLDETMFTESYTFSQKGTVVTKTVVYFPAWVQSEVVHCQEAEIRAYVWANYDRAMSQLTFEGGKRILTEVNEYLKAYKHTS
jgi:8-oxo-dGTP pyrophosphatase MutT (NUDIX family)